MTPLEHTTTGPYLLFAGSIYYAAGGWFDYRGAFASVNAAVEFLQANPSVVVPNGVMPGWAHIVNEGVVVACLHGDHASDDIHDDGIKWESDT